MSARELLVVGDRRLTREFHLVPRRLHGHDPRWVAPLPGETRRAFDPRLQPALTPGRWQRWLVTHHGRGVGRIAAFAPPHRPGTGYFGFFDADPDVGSAAMLLDAASQWLRSLGCQVVHGPVPITARDGIGLLTGGDDGPAAFGCPWNPSYYVGLVEAAGFVPTVRLRSYRWTLAAADQQRIGSVAGRAGIAGRVRVRTIDATRLREETRCLTRLINEALRGAWQYEPVSDGEADVLARQLRRVIDPALVLIAEDEAGPCGVALAVPDLNWAWHRGGNALWPRGWWTLLTARGRIPHVRVLALGVTHRSRGTGAVAQLLDAWLRAGVRGGYASAELAQVFDSNVGMCRILDRMGLPVHRRFAVYSRSLTD